MPSPDLRLPEEVVTLIRTSTIRTRQRLQHNQVAHRYAAADECRPGYHNIVSFHIILSPLIDIYNVACGVS